MMTPVLGSKSLENILGGSTTALHTGPLTTTWISLRNSRLIHLEFQSEATTSSEVGTRRHPYPLRTAAAETVVW